MPRKLPNLNQLRAFEAAARHLSFKDAAEELHVTHAAVSHQIKALEEHFGVRLFRRRTRQIEATDAAARLGERLSELFDQIELATQALSGESLTGELRISVPPYFSDRILMPRLAKFHASHPELTISPSPEAKLVNLQNSPYDAAIRYGDGKWDGLSAIRLHWTRLIPVASPTLVGDRDLPLNAEEIARLPKGCMKGQEIDWQKWLSAAGHSGDPGEILVYDIGTRVVDLAYSGLCVALISTMIVAEDLVMGRLVQLNSTALGSERAMHLTFPARERIDPRLQIFADWLAEEIELASAVGRAPAD
ncbi:MAG: LysR substrate-binding domain-containing protein [Rhizobiaceae bacterium]